jgi:hypothetical protein
MFCAVFDPPNPKCSPGHRRLQDRKVHPRLQLGAELYRVPAMNQRQTVDELFDHLFFHRGLIFRTAKSAEPANAELRQPAVVGSEGNTGNTELCGLIDRGVELQPIRLGLRVPRAKLVDQVRTENMRLAQHDVAWLLQEHT